MEFARVRPSRRWWWRTERQVLAEERAWRVAIGSPGWIPPLPLPDADRALEWPDDKSLRRKAIQEEARRVAGTYRWLRKAFEDTKNEPGAADFYYGEMEMRRRGARSWVERRLLEMYWLTSGYALRAWRAVASLVVLIAFATLLFATVGLAPANETRFVPVPGAAPQVYRQVSVPTAPPGWSAAATLAVESTTSFLRPTQLGFPLTGVGEVTHIALRLLGPLLLGLAALSLRGRVKR